MQCCWDSPGKYVLSTPVRVRSRSPVVRDHHTSMGAQISDWPRCIMMDELVSTSGRGRLGWQVYKQAQTGLKVHQEGRKR